MHHSAEQSLAAETFPGAGEVAVACRAVDWGATALGPLVTWSDALRTAAALTLATPLPAVLVWGADRVVLYNDASRALVGVRHPAALGRPMYVTWPEVWPKVASTYDRVFAGESVVIEEARRPRSAVRGGEEEGTFTITYTPVRDGDVVAGALVLSYETTESVRARDARADAERARGEAVRAAAAAEEARREAEAANQAKGDFLATMSHEIRTPINAVIGYTQLLDLGLAGPVTDGQREYLQRLGASAQHLLGIVNDVLDLAKLDAGELRVASDDAVADEAIAAALDLVRPQAAARGVRLSDLNAAADAAPVPFAGDEYRVRQILVNLLSNAVKFTGPGGAVRVRAESVDEAPSAARLPGVGPWAAVRVRDTGVGIPADQLAAVFDPFHQVEGGKTRSRGGTGLGLAISRRLARLMGGDLTATSRAGEGSEFTLWLPAAGAGREPAHAQAHAQAHEPPRGRGVRAQRVVPPVVRGLAELGAMLEGIARELVERYVERAQADDALPRARAMRRVELEDHVHTFLSDLAQTLKLVGEAGEQAVAALDDGTHIARAVARAHGARRHAQGWGAAELRRDYALLSDVLLGALRSRLAAEGGEAGEALAVVQRLVMGSERAAARAWDAAAQRGAPAGTGEYAAVAAAR